MRREPPAALEAARLQRAPLVSPIGAMYGLFGITYRQPGKATREKLWIISSGMARASGDPVEAWEHVSVSVVERNYCPTWDHMCFVKGLFWLPEETVIQFHPPESQYVDNHAYTLHLWKAPYPTPTPPAITVGIRGLKL